MSALHTHGTHTHTQTGETVFDVKSIPALEAWVAANFYNKDSKGPFAMTSAPFARYQLRDRQDYGVVGLRTTEWFSRLRGPVCLFFDSL